MANDPFDHGKYVNKLVKVANDQHRADLPIKDADLLLAAGLIEDIFDAELGSSPLENKTKIEYGKFFDLVDTLDECPSEVLRVRDKVIRKKLHLDIKRKTATGGRDCSEKIRRLDRFASLFASCPLMGALSRLCARRRPSLRANARREESRIGEQVFGRQTAFKSSFQ